MECARKLHIEERTNTLMEKVVRSTGDVEKLKGDGQMSVRLVPRNLRINCHLPPVHSSIFPCAGRRSNFIEWSHI